MWPHSAHLRRCNHHPPRAKHSTQPVPLGFTVGLIPSLSDFMGSSLTCCCFPLSAARSLQWLQAVHHGRNKLRYRGMNVHRALYHCVRRLGVHDIEHAMNHLVTLKSQEGSTQYLFAIPIHQDFHETLGLASFIRAHDV